MAGHQSSSPLRAMGSRRPALFKVWITGTNNASQGIRQMSSLTFDSFLQSQTNVADICADLKLARHGVIAQDPDSLSQLLARAEKTMLEQQSYIRTLEADKLREKAVSEKEKADLEREKGEKVEKMGEQLITLDREKGDEHAQCVLLRQLLQEAEKDVLRAKRLLTGG
jgi:hypothetical protein